MGVAAGPGLPRSLAWRAMPRPPGAEPRPKPARPAKPEPRPTPAQPAGPEARPAPARPSDRAWVWGLAGLYAATFTFFSVVKYRYYLYTDFDFAIFVQVTDRILHGSFFSSIAGMNLLGAHTTPNLVLIAPLFAVFHHPVTLLVVQSAALALGAIPVHRLAQRRFGPGFIAVSFAALYLSFPALGYVNLFEFHPEALSTPALLFAFDYAFEGRLRPAALWAALALLGREDAALVIAALGIWVLIVHRPRAPAVAAAFGMLAAASLLVTFGFLQRRFASGEVQYIEMYRNWGHTAGEVIASVLRQPLRVVQWLAGTPGDPRDTVLKHQYYIHLLLPLLGLPLLSPWTLAIAAPILVEHLLSWRLNQHTIVCQYTALVTPFVIVAAVLGLENLLRLAAGRRDWRAERGRHGSPVRVLATAVPALALLASLGSNLMFGPLLGRGRLQEFKPTERIWPGPEDRTFKPYRDRMVARVPREVGVVASFEYLPRFAARANVHSFHHLFYGHYTFSTKPFPVPAGIAAMLTALGNQYLPDAAVRERQLIGANHLEPVDAAGDLVLYLQSPGDTLDLLASGALTPSIEAHVVYDSLLRFMGCDVAEPRVRPGEVLTLRTYWSRVAPADKVYLTRLWLYDAQGRSVYYKTRYLGYGVFTADQWTTGRTVRETYRLVVPGELDPGTYRLVMQVVRRTASGAESAVPDDPRLAQLGNLILLSVVEVR